jgi:hypothetical protein
MPAATTTDTKPARHRPKSYTVFAAAFLAGAAAAVGINRVLDVQVAQRRPQVECEPIFVAIRPLPQGAPVTVWDVALKDWPKAMLPTSALRAGDAFEGCVLRHALREGQPLLGVQLVRSGSGDGQTSVEAFVPAVPAPAQPSADTSASADLWTPAASAPTQPTAPPAAPVAASPVPAASAEDKAEVVTAVPAAAPADPASEPDVGSVAADAAAPPEHLVEEVDEATPATPAADQPVVATVPDVPIAPVAPVPTEVPASATPAPTLAAGPAAVSPSRVVDDASEAVATDVSSMPSVMAAPATAGTKASRPPVNEAGRFLVVPERIAMQADTSFTTPRPQPPGPPPTERTSPQQSRPRTPPRPAATRTGQTATQQPAAGSKGQPQQRPPSQQSQRSGPTSSTSKGWGGMFPNVAAGLEAIGGQWQRGRSASGQPQRGDQSISR